MNPYISVVIPLYNKEKYVESSIRSVLNQSFRDIEVIAIDDGSNDGTVNIVKKLCNEDNRIRLTQQKINSGVSSTRNSAILTSYGELISFIDADDIWHPEKLLLQLLQLKKNPLAKIVSCYASVIDKDGNFTGFITGKNLNGNVYRDLLENNGVPCTSAALLYKHCFGEVGFFDGLLSNCADWDLWVRLSRKYQFTTVPKPLVKYRRTSCGLSRSYFKVYSCGKKIITKALTEDKAFNKNYYSFCLARLALLVCKLCILDKNLKDAGRYLMLSFKINPFGSITSIRNLGVAVLIIFSLISPKWLYKAFYKTSISLLTFRIKASEFFNKTNWIQI